MIAIERKFGGRRQRSSAGTRVKIVGWLPCIPGTARATPTNGGGGRRVVNGHVVTHRERIPFDVGQRVTVSATGDHVGRNRIRARYVILCPAHVARHRNCPGRWSRRWWELGDGLTTGCKFTRRAGGKLGCWLERGKVESFLRQSAVRARVSVRARIDDEGIEKVGGRVCMPERK